MEPEGYDNGERREQRIHRLLLPCRYDRREDGSSGGERQERRSKGTRRKVGSCQSDHFLVILCSLVTRSPYTSDHPPRYLVGSLRGER